MSACCQKNTVFDGLSADYRRRLWLVIGLNATMFAVEIVAGRIAGSMALQADALDFFVKGVGKRFELCRAKRVAGFGQRQLFGCQFRLDPPVFGREFGRQLGDAIRDALPGDRAGKHAVHINCQNGQHRHAQGGAGHGGRGGVDLGRQLPRRL